LKELVPSLFFRTGTKCKCIKNEENLKVVPFRSSH
ncbi:MAG: hypothetical protein ACI8TA_003604, partial [Cyclobacteriaceae bacterium]